MTPVAWSFSRLQAYRQCPYKYYRMNMLSKQDPDRVDPYASPSEAMLEGDRMHKSFENSIMHGVKLDPKYEKHNDKITALRQLTLEGKVVACEREMAISTGLKSVSWFSKQAWGRAKADVEIKNMSASRPAGEHALTYIDWKSGKVRDDWMPQGAAMAAVAFCVYPSVQQVAWKVDYVNYDTIKEAVYERDALANIFAPILRTVKDITESVKSGDWEMRETGLCGWCPVTDCPNWRQR